LAAKAVCDICNTEELMESTPMGVALMPKTWLCSVRKAPDGSLKVVDVCSDLCASNFDKGDGLEGTVIRDIDSDGNDVERVLNFPLEN
jgi:hypothetical protein